MAMFNEKIFPFIAGLFLLIFASGCHKDMPKPESLYVEPLTVIDQQTKGEIPVSGNIQGEPFTVHHHVKGNRLFVECVVPGISFRDDSDDKGKIILYINGEKKDEINTAAFVLKGLSPGTHHIKLEVEGRKMPQSSLTKEFTVTIP